MELHYPESPQSEKKDLGGMIDKYESRRIRAEVRRVLLDVWDPIGVKDEPNAQDEYDCCLGSLFHLLTTGATDDQIAEYLWRQGTEHMGLSLQKEAMYPTVAALRQIALPEDQANRTLDTGC